MNKLDDILTNFCIFEKKVDRIREEVSQLRIETKDRFDRLEMQNHQEHQQLMQIIKELDCEVQMKFS